MREVEGEMSGPTVAPSNCGGVGGRRMAGESAQAGSAFDSLALAVKATF